MNPMPYSTRTWWWLYATAALSFATTLMLPYVGEEAVYTITSLEMRLNHDFFVTTLYANNYGRPPLVNWLIIPLAEVLGWNHMLLASRLVTATATVATGLVVAWLARNITRNHGFAAFAALVYLSGDVLFYRGWLAYADSLFTLFVFGAIASLWVGGPAAAGDAAVACRAAADVRVFVQGADGRISFMAWHSSCLCADRDARRFLLGAQLDCCACRRARGVARMERAISRMALKARAQWSISLLKLKSIDLGDYLNQLWSFPLETVLRFAPVSAVAIYFGWRTRHANSADATRRISLAHAPRHVVSQLSAVLAGAENPHPLHHAVVSARRARTRRGGLAIMVSGGS